MFSFGKAKRVVNIVMEDYVIRMVENNGKDFASIKITAEKPLPTNTIQNGKIVDELKFYEFMKEVVQEWGIKNRHVRFYVPHELIIMREIEIPKDVPTNEVKQYITMEIGNTIHFPFNNPVFDIYELAQTEWKNNNVIVLAAPEEEIMKYTEIFADVHLKPIAVDAQALGVYRYFLKRQEVVHGEKVYLFFELNLMSVNISIFYQHEVEFLRFQRLNVVPTDWHPTNEQSIRWTFTGDETRLRGDIEDQINEIDRLMNFYRFSIHQGKRSVTDIVLLGDFPNLSEVASQLQKRYELPVTTLSTELIKNEHVSSVFIPALGLALKGGK